MKLFIKSKVFSIPFLVRERKQALLERIVLLLHWLKVFHCAESDNSTNCSLAQHMDLEGEKMPLKAEKAPSISVTGTDTPARVWKYP